MIRINIAAVPPSNNESQGKGGRKRAFAYQDQKKLWNEWIWVMRSRLKERGELQGISLPYEKATVIMRYNFKGSRRRDPDNYSGKMILDGLKNNGFIVDDSFKDIDIFPMATFDNKEESTEIIILEDHWIREFAEDILVIGRNAFKGGDTG